MKTTLEKISDVPIYLAGAITRVQFIHDNIPVVFLW